MFLKAVFKLFVFDNIVSLWMLELHLAAYASLSDRSPSILLLPACRKLSPVQRRSACLSLIFFFFNEVSFPGGLQPSWILLQWGREGEGCCSECCTGRASPGPPQTRMPFVHWFSMCWSGPGGHTGCFPPPSPPQLVSGLISYLKLLSHEK